MSGAREGVLLILVGVLKVFPPIEHICFYAQICGKLCYRFLAMQHELKSIELELLDTDDVVDSFSFIPPFDVRHDFLHCPRKASNSNYLF